MWMWIWRGENLVQCQLHRSTDEMSWPDARIKLSIQIETDILAKASCHTAASTSHRQSLVNAPRTALVNGPARSCHSDGHKEGKESHPHYLYPVHIPGN